MADYSALLNAIEEEENKSNPTIVQPVNAPVATAEDKELESMASALADTGKLKPKELKARAFLSDIHHSVCSRIFDICSVSFNFYGRTIAVRYHNLVVY